MENSPDKSHIDLVSSGPSAEVPNGPIQESNSQVVISKESDKPDGCDGKIRMRGGCGGGGSSSGGGCGCGSGGGRTNYDDSGHSPLSLRHQSAKEGGCGCGGGRKSGFEGRASSRGLGGFGCDERSSHFSRSGTYSETNSEERIPGSCAAKFPAGSRLTGYETCPPRAPEPCTPDPASLSPCSAVSCSPPCSGRKDCCPPAGQRSGPRKKSARCRPPCSGGSPSCGGGGCCGSGCRGNCGKPGQTCLPLKPCTIPPCMPHPRSGCSPCLPPRGSPPQPPCCHMPVLLGTPNIVSGGGCAGGGSTSCRTKSPGARTGGGGGCSPLTDRQHHDEVVFDPYGQQKVPAGCECLGGGQDCQRCGRKVYQAEMMIASGVPYHNICFSCFCCRKPLETLTYHENCGEIYCKQCYVRNFGPQGYGYSGVLQTPM